jgi:2-dehydro-3-deoxyglucarate aldolase
MVQIESEQALANVEAIAATPGVDCLFIGPADLAASLGHLGDTKHPDVQAAITKIIDTAKQAGIASGIFALDVASARLYAEAGVKVIALSADVGWLLKATRQALQEARA